MNEPTTLPALPEQFIVPVTGEVLNLNVPADVARALKFVREARAQLNEARRVLEEALVAESQRQGTKTLRYGATEATISGGGEWVYDEAAMLAELEAAGLPEERRAELVRTTVEYKVNASVVRQLMGSNPEYGAIIERHRHWQEKAMRVDVRAGA